MERRDLLGFVGGLGFGTLVGYYTGAKHLLGIQPDEVRVPSTATPSPEREAEPTRTPTPTRTPASTRTPTPSSTPTRTPDPTVFQDEFEDGTYSDTWAVTRHHEEEQLTEENGVLTYTSPTEATIYAPDMTVVTKRTFAGSGRHRFEASVRMDTDRRLRVFRVLDANSDDAVELGEVAHKDQLELSLPEDKVIVGPARADGTFREYALTVDFAENTVRSVVRSGDEYQVDRSFGGAFESYELGIGEGNGQSQFQYVRIQRT